MRRKVIKRWSQVESGMKTSLLPLIRRNIPNVVFATIGFNASFPLHSLLAWILVVIIVVDLLVFTVKLLKVRGTRGATPTSTNDNGVLSDD